MTTSWPIKLGKVTNNAPGIYDVQHQAATPMNEHFISPSFRTVECTSHLEALHETLAKNAAEINSTAKKFQVKKEARREVEAIIHKLEDMILPSSASEQLVKLMRHTGNMQMKHID